MWSSCLAWKRAAAIAWVSAGLALPFPVHAQPAAAPRAGSPAASPPCFDNINRYVDCGNGTVTDTVTGLVWLKDSTCLGVADWALASSRAAELSDGACGLTDGSAPGQWRLPTLTEWQATIARAVTIGCTHEGPGVPPALTDNAGTACLHEGPAAFTGVYAGSYWTRAANEQHPNNAWAVSLVGTIHGFVYPALKTFPLPAWPVRSP
jgi:hypothetical protein